jgi:hypothetical protein
MIHGGEKFTPKFLGVKEFRNSKIESSSASVASIRDRYRGAPLPFEPRRGCANKDAGADARARPESAALWPGRYAPG